MISSFTNQKVKLVRALQTQRRVRYRQKMLVVEGARLLADALATGLPPDFVLYSSTWKAASDPDLITPSTPAFLASEAVMAYCADTETPQGVLAVFPFPGLPLPTHPNFVLVIDRLRTPGNLGTILRSAAAAGVDMVLLPPGNVDPYNPKVLRGGMGAHFRLPIASLPWHQVGNHLTGLDCWLAAAGRGRPYDQINWSQPVALIVGGEAGGASRDAKRLAGGIVHIPMPGGMESLNAAVAAGVLLFEIVRQRSAAQEPPLPPG